VSLSDPQSALISAAVLATVLLATPAFVWVAHRTAWIDRRAGSEALRKPRTEPVPLVGGAVLLVGLLVASALGGAPPGLPWPALVGALLLGLADDRRRGGLPPGTKLLGQCAVGLLLVLVPGFEGDLAQRALGCLLAVVAMNAINTFDNADGAVVALGLLAFAPVAAVRSALLGFLPFNLPWRRGGAPAAYLGDSGSHVVGLLIAWHPAARLALLLPLLDLGRLVFVRLSRGQAPWVGDRRHLAHRLEAAGLPRPAVALALVLAALPPFLGRGRSLAGLDGAWVGACVTAVIFAFAVRWTPEPGTPEPPGGPRAGGAD